VTLKADGDRLLFSPAAAIPPDLRAAMVRHKPELLALLAPPPFWVVPDDPAVERLLAQGVGRGEIWTRAELQILGDLTPAGARTLTLAKRLFDSEVIRPPESSGAASEPELPLRLDPTTVSEVLGPASVDPAAVAALEAEVRAAVVHAHDELAVSVDAQGVLQVRGRPLADYLDLDTVAQLLRATPEAQRLFAALARKRPSLGRSKARAQPFDGASALGPRQVSPSSGSRRANPAAGSRAELAEPPKRGVHQHGDVSTP
jgi:hypothetical protein